MADHAVTVELYYGAAWHDVTADTLVAEGITMTRGIGDNLEPIPGEVSLAFLNADGAYNPASPASALYDVAGLNTPLRATVDADVQVGEVAEWRPSQPLGGTSRCAVTASGVLRRLGQGETPLKAPLRRVLEGAAPAAWWPLDDATGSLQARSAVAGVGPLTFDDSVRPGVVDAPDTVGGGKRPEFSADNGTTFSGIMTSPGLGDATSAGGFVLDVWVRFGLGDASISDMGAIYFTGSTLARALLQFSNTGIDADDPMAVTFALETPGGVVESVSTVGIVRETWTHLRMWADQSGGDIDIALEQDGVETDADTMTGQTLGRVDTVVLGGYDVNAFNTAESIAYSDLVVWDTLTPPDVAGAGAGYTGETAADRFARLCEEEGVPATVVGDPAESEPMGPQPVDTLTEVLAECVRTDAALMYATRDEVGLTFRTGRSLYGQDPVLTLDLAAEQVSAPVDPIVGDQLVRNDVTAKDSEGREGRSVLESGRMSVLPPPDGVGRYSTTWSVNPADPGRLEAHAAWHINRGTYAGVRYRTVTVDMDAVGSTGLAGSVAALDIGDVVRLTGIDPAVSPDDFLGMVIRTRQTVGARRRLVSLSMIPARPYEVGIVGNTAGAVDLRGQRIDSSVAALSAGVTSSATSLSVKTTGGVLLTTNADAWNTGINGGGLFLTVGGEVVRVTAIAGASSPQTVTVVRSVNGVTKSHSADAPVRVLDGIRVGL